MSSEIEDFVAFLFEGYKKGFVYAPHRIPGKDWETQFFPVSKTADIVAYLSEMGKYADVYVAPTLFKVPNKGPAKKWLRDGSTIYVDLDGNAPENVPSGIPEPGYRLKSSLPGREHWFWKLDADYPPQSLEVYNRSLALTLNADTSGFDSTQVLRVPGTFNFKRSTPLPVEIISSTEEKYSAGQFAKIIVKSEKKMEKEELKTGKIPSFWEASTSIQWPPQLRDFFASTDIPKEGTRSEALWGFTKDLIRAEMSTEGAVAIVRELCTRWYPEGRNLNTIKTDVSKAYGEVAEELTELGIFKITERPVKLRGWTEFLSSEDPTPPWLIENLLHEGSTGIIGANPFAGKTVFSMHLAAHVALGRTFLDWKIDKPRKTAFISMEMSQGLTKRYMQQISPVYANDFEELKENFNVSLSFSVGDFRGTDSGKREQLLNLVEDQGVEFLVIDSLTASVGRDYDDMSEYISWITQEFPKIGVTPWIIHHATKGLEKAEFPGLEHLYGSFDLAAKVDTVMLMRRGVEDKHTVELVPAKVRALDNLAFMDNFKVSTGHEGLFYERLEGIAKAEDMGLGKAYVEHTKSKSKSEPDGQTHFNPYE